jgi:hypothetical protein
MKAVEVLQKVQSLPRATASHQPGRKARWREETNVRSRVEQVSRVCMEPRKLLESRGPARDNHPQTPERWVGEPRTVSVRWNAVSAGSLMARPGGGHRGRRPDHAETGIARELVSASSASCLACADHWGVHRAIKAPLGKARGPAGSIHLAKRGDDRHGGTSGNAKALRTGARQSSRSRVALAATPLTANAYANPSGHRQPGKTCAREVAGPGSQGTPSARGTWCSEGDAGRHLRPMAGQGQGTPSPLPVPLRLERIATQAREYPEMDHGSRGRNRAGVRAETDDAGCLSRRTPLPYGNVRHRGTV